MGLFDTLFGRRQASRPSQPASASVAKQRLVEVLIQDHVKLTPAAMEAIRQDIVKILSRHLDIDADALQIHITRGERGESLTANVPVRRSGVPQRR
ncbi:cell division topological specificity factor MinE [Sphaerobacter sp.]|uniref:cell division topological specificity factor MinE n=1 Tax=Sphaerobacter sp. TaxID=2099654 RepID=UPI001E1817AF|nr:cell division topological specificity factor MinE [Sphaerobacter sp.]MBX5443878.1 cell division topological specificity factor MinE [Sphaerobacter sp.]